MSQAGPAAEMLPGWAADLFAQTPALLRPGLWSATAATSARISDQFKANASDYHARYSASAHFEHLFRQALEASGAQVTASPLILDMGSGSGANSVVPCFSLFPGARQVATDLSAELLAILADHGAEQGWSDRLVCVAMDVMGDHLARRRFDLVTGSAILHHLEQPNLALLAAARALKPGGHAIFFEPFDGYGLMRLAYERILAEAALRGEALHPQIEQTLNAMVADIASRTEPDAQGAAFKDMDDKWLFSREAMETMARDCNFCEVRLVPLNNHASLYHDTAAVQLRLSSGGGDLSLPAWAEAILRDFDRALPRAAKGQLMLEGAVVLTKGATVAPLPPQAQVP